ncbi:MAG: hypothetical protein RDV48_24385 [Candidatus Eremiobacteraeota bacterium]|nr:hypothetical protein [Candidatus Eremiobacteraeota bacterium]
MKYSIRPKSRLWHLCPALRDTATAIGHSLFMPEWFFALEREVEREALIAHELVHVRQFEREGWLFWLRYLTSRRRRREYELAGYEEQIKYLVHRGDTPDAACWAAGMADYGPLSWITAGEAVETVRQWIAEASKNKLPIAPAGGEDKGVRIPVKKDQD